MATQTPSESNRHEFFAALEQERNRLLGDAAREARANFLEMNERLTRERSRVALRIFLAVACACGLSMVLGGFAGWYAAQRAARGEVEQFVALVRSEEDASTSRLNVSLEALKSSLGKEGSAANARFSDLKKEIFDELKDRKTESIRDIGLKEESSKIALARMSAPIVRLVLACIETECRLARLGLAEEPTEEQLSLERLRLQGLDISLTSVQDSLPAISVPGRLEQAEIADLDKLIKEARSNIEQFRALLDKYK